MTAAEAQALHARLAEAEATPARVRATLDRLDRTTWRDRPAALGCGAVGGGACSIGAEVAQGVELAANEVRTALDVPRV